MKQKVDYILERILILIMALMVINVLWQVASRYIMSNPSSFTDELAGFLLIWVGILGSGYATGQGLHMAIDLLPSSLEGKKKLIVNSAIQVTILLFAIFIMIIGGGQLVALTFKLEQLSSALRVPMGYVYLVIPISGVLMAYYSIHFLIKNLSNGSN